MAGSGRRAGPHVLARAVGAVVTGVLAVTLTAVPVQAQRSPLEALGTFEVEIPDEVDARGFPANANMIFNPDVRRAYTFMRGQGAILVRSYDLDSRTVVVERRYLVAEFGQLLAPATNAQEWIHTINPETGELFIAYASGGGFAGINVLDGETLEILRRLPYERVTYSPPDVDPEDPQLPCTASSCLPQAPTVVPTLVGMSFVSSVLTGLHDKLLLQMQDLIWPPGLHRNANVSWMAQWDAATGNQDWIYNVRACSNAVYPGRDFGLFMLAPFQASSAPGIYMTCQLSGGTGQVVRLVVDASNIPLNEQSYPGPQSVVDSLADPASDRMLLRVANEAGESWWVFDGRSSSYTGVVGATGQPAQTANGIDVTTGRLYVAAPSSQTDDGRTVGGGLLLSDIRRSPAPQFLQFREYARALRAPIRVDAHPETGERVVYLPRGDGVFDLIRDNVEVQLDERVGDLDRLTIDREEEEGVTGSNFTGSGHAYGLRALLAGGLEGFPPTGPDVSGIRVGRYVPMMMGSPCGSGDREVTIGSVQRAGLSNSLASASVAIAEADAGTKTDLGEPSARCYPRPRDATGSDIWTTGRGALGSPEDRFGEYPRPLDEEIYGNESGKTDIDELVGVDWPFHTTECLADETERETTASLTPLDRGGPARDVLPEDVRDHEVEISGFRAGVVCDIEGGAVDAFSELVLYREEVEQPSVEIEVPEIGTLTIGEISTTVSIVLDPERGLVSRSVAIVRGISFGDHASVEGAVAVAEAWAAGRPGTASTSFERAICGVKIKDQAPDTQVNLPSAAVDDQRLLEGDLDAITIDPEGGGEVQKGVAKSLCGDPDEPQIAGIIQETGNIDEKQPLVDVLNRVLGARGRVNLPEPDSELKQGTPGGYLASVQKDRLEEISSRAVSNDASTQVPAMEIIIFNDDPAEGRGRQVYQFAGVDASVTYGVFLLNPLDDPGDLPGFLNDFPLPQGFDIPDIPDQVIVHEIPPRAGGPITVLFQGINFLLRSPKDALLAAAVWGLLFAPIQLAGRRRALKGVRVA